MESRIEQKTMSWGLKNKWNVLGLIVLLGNFAQAQVAPEKYWIQFTDKANSTYSVSQPLQFLSQKAIDRRIHHNVAITEQDFPINANYVDSVLQTVTANVLVSSRWLNGIVIQTIDTVGLSQLWQFPFIDSANSKRVSRPITDHSYPWNWKGEVVANEPQTGLQSESFDYGLSTVSSEMIAIDYLHDLGYTGGGMVIAVLDAGFKNAQTDEVLSHLWNDNQILGTYDFVVGGPVDLTAHSDHGRYVLQCLAADLPGRFIGTAPDAEYWLLRTEDAPTEYIVEEYNWVAGAEFADSVGADIFTTSLGYTEYDDSTTSHVYAKMDGNSTVITRASDIAASKGVLVVNSAGNSGTSPWYFISAPADGDSVLTVGSVKPDQTISDFSSRGPTADGRIKPNVVAMGEDLQMHYDPDSILVIRGTSFSGPTIAGAAACLWQSQNSSTNMEVFFAIQNSGNYAQFPNNDFGYGIPNFENAYSTINGISERNLDVLSSGFYPNPTTGVVHFPGGKFHEYSISVFDNLGRRVRQYTSLKSVGERIELDLTELASGLYSIQITSETETKVGLILKQ
jgi:hypothetical protein